MIKLNLGCGGKLLEGYVNHDLATDGVDIGQLPYEDGAVDEIQCHHVIEHVERDKVAGVFQEWHRALRVGGQLVVSCPDVIACMRRFLKLSDEERWKAHGMNESIWGSQNYPYTVHKTGFSLERLKRMLVVAGFKVIRAERVGGDHGAPGLLAEAVK